MGGGDCAADGFGACNHGGTLAERDSILQKVDDGFGERREATADVVEAGAWAGSGTGPIGEQAALRAVRGVQVRRYSDGCCTQPLGIYRTARSPGDAPDEPLACASVGALLDDWRDPGRRRLAVVWARHHGGDLWRAAEIRGCWRGGRGWIWRDFCLQSDQAVEYAAAALPVRAALLVEGFTSRQIFVSF